MTSNEQRKIKKILVAIGSTKHKFERINILIDTIARIYPDSQINIQSGYTSIIENRVVNSIPFMTPSRFTSEIAESDLVISHSGSGTILEILENGKIPVLLPRFVDLGEHTDKSQVTLAEYLEKRNLALVINKPDDYYEVLNKCIKAERTNVVADNLTNDPMECLSRYIFIELSGDVD
jgi:UDP-N-acetylglucosamine transferase subunit ALG13